MSFGTAHTFSLLSKEPKALPEQRLVRLISKKKERSDNLQVSLAVSIPTVSVESVRKYADALMPHVARLVQDTQDKIIREYRIKTGADTISDGDISIQAVIEYLNADAAGDRVSAEYLQGWFMDGYADTARDWITAKLGGNVASEVLDTKVNVLRDMFAGWSSPKNSPNIPSLKAMIEFIGEIPEDSIDSRMEVIGERAIRMLEKKEAELSADALGF